jgi:hypothetical protein
LDKGKKGKDKNVDGTASVARSFWTATLRWSEIEGIRVDDTASVAQALSTATLGRSQIVGIRLNEK